MNSIRAFVAANLPVAVVNQAVEIQSGLRRRAREQGMSVSWVPPQNMHVTMKFLAEIPEESLWAVRDCLQERLSVRPAITATVRGLGAFPGRENPRVLWLGVESEGDALVQLAGAVDGWLEELGFQRETRPFHPHLTLGRVKQGSVDILEGLDPVDLGQCRVTEAALFRSVLKRQGSEYIAMARLPLHRPAARPGAGVAPSTDSSQT